jgi:predicted LPLAT superfamily acyltransferase
MVRNEAAEAASWASLPERGAYLGLCLVLGAYAAGGRLLSVPLVRLVTTYFFLTNPPARRASREYLRKISGHPSSRAIEGAVTSRSVWRHFNAFSDAILDKLRAWRGDVTLEQIEMINAELFRERHAAGNGGLWITSHVGNVEVSRALSRRLGLRMTVLVHTRHAPNFNRLLQRYSGDSSIDLLQVDSFDVAMAIKLKKKIDRGQFIVIVGDRTPISGKGRVVRAPFLGDPASFPVGPFVLASTLGCPVGTLFCVKDGDRFRLIMEDLPGLRNTSRANRRDAIQAAVREYAARLEALCLEFPYQWFNFFDFWNQPGTEQWPHAPREHRHE